MQGLPQARGYDPVNARWIGEWFNLLAGREPGPNPGGFMFVPKILRPAWLTLAGVETIVAYTPLDGVPGLKPVARFDFPPDPQVPGATATTATVWRNERFRGRASPRRGPCWPPAGARRCMPRRGSSPTPIRRPP
jgi:hypothetical protein